MKVKRLNNRDVWQDEIMTMLNRFGNDDADKRYLMELNKRIVQHINNISRNNTSVALRKWNVGGQRLLLLEEETPYNHRDYNANQPHICVNRLWCGWEMEGCAHATCHRKNRTGETRMKKYTVLFMTPYMTYENVIAESELDAIRQCETPSKWDGNEPSHWEARREKDV